jgi:hypothetical protein
MIGGRPGDEPEARIFGLASGAAGAGFAAEILDLVVIDGPLLAGQRERWLGPEL